MTEDQIKAIASELAEQISPSPNPVGRLSAYRQCFIVLKALADRYCIVEREKVIQKYNEVKAINDACDDLLADDRAVFHYLFGTSMFNQNEE